MKEPLWLVHDDIAEVEGGARARQESRTRVNYVE
jgi:hypothetical protein